MTERDFHPEVKRLLDGEITLADLPAELRAEGEEALALLAALDRRPVALPGVTWRVMVELERAAARRRRAPWQLIAPALAAAALLALWLGRSTAPHVAPPSTVASVTVHFVLSAPEAHRVSIAGTFNQWDPTATPLVRSGPQGGGLWTATLMLPPGQHQYVFVVDGARWIPDPTAPAVDDGFGRRNSVLTL
jgi:AMP-activated protein kinase-like protein